MYETREAMESLLRKSKDILSEQPGLFDNSPEEILEKLNDGTQEMIHVRWGVAAFVFVNGIEDLSYEGLAHSLTETSMPDNLCGKVMYILQRDKGINTIKLMVAARHIGRVEKTIPFVCRNFAFDERIGEEEVGEFIDTINDVSQKSIYVVINGFAKRVVAESLERQAFLHVMKGVTDKGLLFLQKLICEVYKQDQLRGNIILDIMLNDSQKNRLIDVIVAGIMASFNYDVEEFSSHFDVLDTFWDDSNTCQRVIPCYVQYALIVPEDDVLRIKVMERLKGIPQAKLCDKQSFMGAVMYQKKEPRDLEIIVEEISSTPFEKDSSLLQSLITYWYSKKHKTAQEELWHIIRNLFIVNGYGAKDRREFFEAVGRLLPKGSSPSEVWECFIESMLSEGDAHLQFALGLFEHVLIPVAINRGRTGSVILESSALMVLKIIALFTHDTEDIVQFAFSLIEQIDSLSEAYINNCIDIVYREYPGTSHNVAQKYLTATNEWQRSLAKRIEEQYENDRANQSAWHEVPDLYPSNSRIDVYRHVQMEWNQQINRDAQKHSITGLLFRNVMMKYGCRFVQVIKLKSGKYACQTGGYTTHEIQYEMPSSYVYSPIARQMKMYEVLEERRAYIEACHQGLSVATEGKG